MRLFLFSVFEKRPFAFHVLRLGLGGVFLYSSTNILSDPSNWIGFMPAWFSEFLPIAPLLFLKIQAYFELTLAILFLLGALIRLAAFFAAFELVAILVVTGITLVTFRDIGLLAAALALLFMNYDSS